MSTKNTIKFSTILKRSQCLNSLSESSRKNNCDRLYENVIRLLERCRTGKEPNVQLALRSYLENMCDSYNASNYYWQPLKLIEEFNKIDSDISEKIIYEYTTRILPYTEDLNNISSCISRYSLYESQYENINEYISLYNTADRIIKNHNNISKRFNIDRTINKYRSTGLKYFIDNCADMISTYNIPNYQKMNITLEESSYILNKNGIHYDEADVIRYALEYYLTQSPSISNKELNDYRRTIKESYVLEESDLFKVKYIFEDVIETNSIESSINKFLVNGNKNEESLTACIKDALSSTSKEDIVYNTDKIVYMLWDLAKNKIFESDESIYKCNTIIADYISEIAKLETIVLDKNFNKEDVTSIINSLIDVSNCIKDIGNGYNNYTKESSKFIKYGLNPCIESLTEVRDLLYNKANIDAINYVNNESAEIVNVNEFKVFKFHNLVRAAFNLDKFLKVKEKKFYTNAKIKVNKFIKRAKNILFDEFATVESNMFDYIGEDCKADICVRQYPFNESELTEVIEFLEDVCAEYNDVLLSQNETNRAYFMINPGLAEIRIKESSIISLEDTSEIYNHLDPAMDTYFEMVIDSNETCDIYDKINTDSIESIITNITKCKQFTLEQFEVALEAMSIIGVDKDIVSLFGDKFNDYHFNYALNNGIINESYIRLAGQEREVAKLVEEFNIEESVSWEDKVQAYSYLNQIFEYSYPSSTDDDDDEDEEPKKKTAPEVKKPEVNKPTVNKKENTDTKKEDKPPKDGYKSKGINLNSIKLGLMGLKSKIKEFDTKQKEASRNIDASANNLIKGIKDSLTSNRREAIIKGSIIPSFSRCIKASIALGFVANFSLPIAVISAVGALALSKKLTKRERLLLLDEIETELEVVEKELNIADSNNDIKKYRTLLQYKKNLQRQYQRIRYNIRVGKDILPGSAAGVPSKSDND